MIFLGVIIVFKVKLTELVKASCIHASFYKRWISHKILSLNGSNILTYVVVIGVVRISGNFKRS
jgi:hypothetical protein